MKQKTVSSFIILSITLSLVLCTFFVSPITASKTLKGNEFSRINQCEKKFWWKSREDFDKTLKKLCMKPYQDHHNNRKKRFRKGENCDKPESWNIKDWERKKNTWESRNKEGKYKSLNKFDKVRSKSSQKLLWKQFQKVSDCKCSVLKFKVSNPVGISVCHQIISINKADGNFVSMITVFRSFERDEFKGKHAFLGFKYDKNIKVKFHGLKKLHDDFLFGSKSLFTYKGEDSDGNPALISKLFVLGEIPKKTSMNKIDIDVISPIAYKVVVQISKNSKKVLRLKSGKEFKNIPVSKFTLYSPFAPYFNGDHNKKDGKQKYQTTSTTSTSSSSSTNTPTYTPTPSVSATDTLTSPDAATDTPTGTSTSPDAATDIPTGTSTSPDAATDTPTDTPIDTPTDTGDSVSDTTDTNTISNPTVKADNAQQTTNNVPVPGQQINAAPIGLIVFGVVVAIGAAFVGYTTYERRRYRKQFNQREKLQQQNPSLAAVPDLGRAI